VRYFAFVRSLLSRRDCQLLCKRRLGVRAQRAGAIDFISDAVRGDDGLGGLALLSMVPSGETCGNGLRFGSVAFILKFSGCSEGARGEDGGLHLLFEWPTLLTRRIWSQIMQ
jgi:hypothetical protein